MSRNTRVDLHLHSHASGKASNLWVKGLGEEVQESYTPPGEAYRMARSAGMDFVTLTDHETVEGALTLTHHPDFLVGEEVSALFPEDGCYADLLIYGLDREVHREAQSRRGNVYDLVDYLREARIVHVLAHPMYGMPGPLTRQQVEKRLALFGLWEFINGSRPATQNRLARDIAESAGAADLRQLAARHGLPSPPHRSIAGTGGSDDHGGLCPGSTFTIAPPAETPQEFLAAMAAGEVRPGGEDGSPAKLAHTELKIAATALKRGDGEGAAGALRRLSPTGALQKFRPSGKGLRDHLPLLANLDQAGMRRTLLSLHKKKLTAALQGGDSGLPVADLMGSLRELLEAYMYVAPYVGMHGYFGRESSFARSLGRELFSEDRSPKIGVFVDESKEIPSMYRDLESAVESRGADGMRILRCGGEQGDFKAVAGLPVPLHEGMELGVPSLVEVLDHVAEEEYDALHVAAPGPLGLAALIAGLLTGIPVVGAYHTNFGAYARDLSGDEMVAGAVEAAVREFYERCHTVAVPSQSMALSLRNRGYRIKRFETLKNGVDAGPFPPQGWDSVLEEFFALHSRAAGFKTEPATLPPD